ncbi:hypothetical protein NQZ68_012906 [Dissostichus eleginoides]|nr:hypothetical protein NQZ68_012906 [Dissostichus eleginoides]
MLRLCEVSLMESCTTCLAPISSLLSEAQDEALYILVILLLLLITLHNTFQRLPSDLVHWEACLAQCAQGWGISVGFQRSHGGEICDASEIIAAINGELLACPIVGGGLVCRGKGQMRPHLDRPHILPTLTPVSQDAPHLSAAIKGCLPTSTP